VNHNQGIPTDMGRKILPFTITKTGLQLFAQI
jgi:hypothetical protein